MRIDWKGSYVETSDLSVHMVRAGKGMPVIFLHGWPEFARTWMHNLPVLAEHFDCIAPEFRGFGQTVSKEFAAGERHAAPTTGQGPRRLRRCAGDQTLRYCLA